MGWRAFPDHHRRILFFWSQKSACTTLFRLIADNMARPPEAKQWFVLHSVPLPMARDLIERHGFRSVILVRHPASRMVSAFLNKFVVHYGQPIPRHGAMEPFARDLHADICAHAGRRPGPNCSTFEEFLAAVARLHATRPDPWARLDGHWDTQAPPRLAETGFRYDHILRVETMDADLARVAPELGLIWRPTALNRTDYAPGETDAYLGRTPAQRLLALPYRPGNFLNTLNLSLIRAVHAGDYRLFGYGFRPGDPVADPAAGPAGAAA
ncbi:MAG TPA: sulfotransferase family 2 domain-containing protein [Paracoccaceae bacterium]|nr:sulfotransferase family 2 domain-containing protein [Paracoccaceae bacterium]